jgi:hypothetical protein
LKTRLRTHINIKAWRRKSNNPTMFTKTTGNSFLATSDSNRGISMTPREKSADNLSKITAIMSWMKRRVKGSPGALIKMALFLE